jgi:hypothetical protein
MTRMNANKKRENIRGIRVIRGENFGLLQT